MVRITETQHNILLAFLRYYFLTGDQVNRLFFSKGAYKYGPAQLLLLMRMGLLSRQVIPSRKTGWKPYVYRMTDEGRNYLKRARVILREEYRERHAYMENAFITLDHTIALNDVLIAGELFSRLTPITLASFKHERELVRDVAKANYKGEKIAVTPDGWMDFHFPDGTRQAVSLEVDRATENIEPWKQKVRAIVAWADGPYEKMFDTTSLVVAVVTPDAKRTNQLRTWTKHELERLGKTNEKDLFLFTHENPVDDPLYFYSGHHWRNPIDDTPIPLLEMNE